MTSFAKKSMTHRSRHSTFFANAAEKEKALVFSLALNGYQFTYRNEIRSHRVYAKKHSLDYALISRPLFTGLLMECCWLKLVLALSALEAGYRWIFYIDADAEIREDCPDFRTVEMPGKDVYMAPGYSGRLNSGVIIVKNTPSAKSFIKSVLKGYSTDLPREDRVGWGENGHIIHFARNLESLQTLPQEWNNNHNPNMHDFVRHYSAGPMRKFHKMSLSSRAAARLSVLAVNLIKRAGGAAYDASVFPRTLMHLFKQSTRHKKAIFKPLDVADVFSDLEP